MGDSGPTIFAPCAFLRPRQLRGRDHVKSGRCKRARIDVLKSALHARSMLRLVKTASPGDVAGAPETEARSIAAESALDDRARAALGGDATALRNFLGDVVPIVRRICHGVMGRNNPELEDAIQDCLIDVARALPQFRFEGRTSHYVTKIAMRRAIACRQRARDRSKQQSTLEPAALVAATFDAGAGRPRGSGAKSARRSERGAGEGAPAAHHAGSFDGRGRDHDRCVREHRQKASASGQRHSSAAG